MGWIKRHMSSQPIAGGEPTGFSRGNYRGAWWEQQTQDSPVEQPEALDLYDLHMVNEG